MVSCLFPVSEFWVQETRKQIAANVAIPMHFLERRFIINIVFMDEASVAKLSPKPSLSHLHPQ
jgi:hypothetical protein